MRRAAISVALLLTPWTAKAEDSPAVHVVDLARTYQTIDHFGASDCWTTRILGNWNRKARERVADLLFSREASVTR